MPARRSPASNIRNIPNIVVASVEPIVHDQIALRAFELYLERGGEHGHDVEDWLRAEREVLENVTEAMSA